MTVRRAIPSAVFKYVGPDRCDILEALEIRFTQPSDANDPFECMLTLEGADEEGIVFLREKMNGIAYRQHVIKANSEGQEPLPRDEFEKRFAPVRPALLEKLKSIPDNLRERHTQRGQKLWDDLGILSLTEEPNDLLMWAHYAAEHKGALIEFDPKHEFFNRPSRTGRVDFGSLWKVIYSNNRPSHPIGQAIPPEDLLIKSEEWKRENEWRVFEYIENCRRKDPTSNCYLSAIPAECITGVVLGCRMDSGKESEWLKLLDRADLKHIRIRKAKPHLDCFKLNYAQIRPRMGL